MSEILWVNPVGTPDFDEEAREMIDAVRAPHHTPRIRHIEGGPPHLEYHRYEHDALGPMLELFLEAEADGCAAGVIGPSRTGICGYRKTNLSAFASTDPVTLQ